MPLALRLSEGLGPNAQTREVFSPLEVEQAVRQFLEYGEQQFGISQKGYYSGSGWAARRLGFHLEQLTRPKAAGLGA